LRRAVTVGGGANRMTPVSVRADGGLCDGRPAGRRVGTGLQAARPERRFRGVRGCGATRRRP
jgi:hypothetical protein